MKRLVISLSASLHEEGSKCMYTCTRSWKMQKSTKLIKSTESDHYPSKPTSEVSKQFHNMNALCLQLSSLHANSIHKYDTEAARRKQTIRNRRMSSRRRRRRFRYILVYRDFVLKRNSRKRSPGAVLGYKFFFSAPGAVRIYWLQCTKRKWNT